MALIRVVWRQCALGNGLQSAHQWLLSALWGDNIYDTKWSLCCPPRDNFVFHSHVDHPCCLVWRARTSFVCKQTTVEVPTQTMGLCVQKHVGDGKAGTARQPLEAAKVEWHHLASLLKSSELAVDMQGGWICSGWPHLMPELILLVFLFWSFMVPYLIPSIWICLSIQCQKNMLALMGSLEIQCVDLKIFSALIFSSASGKTPSRRKHKRKQNSHLFHGIMQVWLCVSHAARPNRIWQWVKSLGEIEFRLIGWSMSEHMFPQSITKRGQMPPFLKWIPTIQQQAQSEVLIVQIFLDDSGEEKTQGLTSEVSSCHRTSLVIRKLTLTGHVKCFSRVTKWTSD